ncbi:MAG TPA: ATP-binding cassette domain-containing protein, partial [Vicinamibacteria bacterium]|nr:ATP-binding cassette domain-containing protein [Vicinamibacteria bacterium]
MRTEVKEKPLPPPTAAEVEIEIRDVNLSYGTNHVLHDISMDIGDKEVTAFIGPSGCGKSTLLRCLNRMNDLIDDVHTTGTIKVKGLDIYAPKTDVIAVRRRIGMVFQKSNPFPKSIYENVVYGLRIAGISDKAVLDEAAERSLRGAALWDEVKDRLGESGLSLSGGQQ